LIYFSPITFHHSHSPAAAPPADALRASS
jgi:hypothetical protein